MLRWLQQKQSHSQTQVYLKILPTAYIIVNPANTFRMLLLKGLAINSQKHIGERPVKINFNSEHNKDAVTFFLHNFT